MSRFAIRLPYLIIVICLITCVAGVTSLLRMPVDVVLHPRRSVIDLDFTTLEREVAAVFRAIQKASEQQAASLPSAGD